MLWGVSGYQTNMVYIWSGRFLCQNAHTTKICLTGAPHSLKDVVRCWSKLAKGHISPREGLTDPACAWCSRERGGMRVQHSLHLVLWVCTPPSEAIYPVESLLVAALPAKAHERSAISAWLQWYKLRTLCNRKGITRRNSHFLCITVQMCIPSCVFKQKSELHHFCTTRKLCIVSAIFYLLWACLVQDLSQLLMCLQWDNSWHALFQLLDRIYHHSRDGKWNAGPQ